MQIFKNYPNMTVVFACLFWGTYWIPLRYIDENNQSSVWPIFLSFAILSIILFKPLIISFKESFLKKNYFFLIGCFFAALAISLYSESLLRGEIAKVVVLFYLCPIWGTILAKIFLKQFFTIKRVISVILGILGLEIIVGIEKGIFLPSSLVEWIALFAGVSWAISMTYFNLAKSTSALQKTSLTTFMIPFIFLFLCFVPGGRSFTITPSLLNFDIIYVWIALFSVLWLLPSILLTYFSVETLDPGRINILLAFEVVVGITSSSLLTQENIGIRELLGAALVISACFVDVISLNKKKNRNYNN